MAKDLRQEMKKRPQKNAAKLKAHQVKRTTVYNEPSWIEKVPEGLAQLGEKISQEINDVLQATSDNIEALKEKYDEFTTEFKEKAENYAEAMSLSLKKNIHRKSNYGCPNAYCVAGSKYASNQVTQNPKYQDFSLPITSNLATDVSEQLANVYGEANFHTNLHEAISAEIAKNPTEPQVFSVQRSSRYSNSGLHYVTVAPTLDNEGKIVRDEKGNVLYSVYSFNRNSVSDFVTNTSLKTTGHYYNITHMAYIKEQEKFYENNIKPLEKQDKSKSTNNVPATNITAMIIKNKGRNLS